MPTMNVFYTTLKEQIEDVTSLDVVTLTGSIKIQGEGNSINLKKTYDSIQTNAVNNTNMSVVAFTHIDLDKDVVQFVKEGLSEGEKPVVDAHNAMVDSSHKARLALIRSIKDIVGL